MSLCDSEMGFLLPSISRTLSCVTGSGYFRMSICYGMLSSLDVLNLLEISLGRELFSMALCHDAEGLVSLESEDFKVFVFQSVKVGFVKSHKMFDDRSQRSIGFVIMILNGTSLLGSRFYTLGSVVGAAIQLVFLKEHCGRQVMNGDEKLVAFINNDLVWGSLLMLINGGEIPFSVLKDVSFDLQSKCSSTKLSVCDTKTRFTAHKTQIAHQVCIDMFAKKCLGTVNMEEQMFDGSPVCIVENILTSDGVVHCSGYFVDQTGRLESNSGTKCWSLVMNEVISLLVLSETAKAYGPILSSWCVSVEDSANACAIIAGFKLQQCNARKGPLSTWYFYSTSVAVCFGHLIQCIAGQNCAWHENAGEFNNSVNGAGHVNNGCILVTHFRTSTNGNGSDLFRPGFNESVTELVIVLVDNWAYVKVLCVALFESQLFHYSLGAGKAHKVVVRARWANEIPYVLKTRKLSVNGDTLLLRSELEGMVWGVDCFVSWLQINAGVDNELVPLMVLMASMVGLSSIVKWSYLDDGVFSGGTYSKVEHNVFGERLVGLVEVSNLASISVVEEPRSSVYAENDFEVNLVMLSHNLVMISEKTNAGVYPKHGDVYYVFDFIVIKCFLHCGLVWPAVSMGYHAIFPHDGVERMLLSGQSDGTWLVYLDMACINEANRNVPPRGFYLVMLEIQLVASPTGLFALMHCMPRQVELLML